MIELSSATSALAFVVPPLLAVLIAAAGFSLFFWWINKMSPAKDSAGTAVAGPGFADLFTLAAGFGGFGYILGFFVGVSHQPLATAVLGTLTASGTTFLAMLYGKDAIPNSARVIPCALITLFFGVVLTMEYGTISLGGK